MSWRQSLVLCFGWKLVFPQAFVFLRLRPCVVECVFGGRKEKGTAGTFHENSCETSLFEKIHFRDTKLQYNSTLHWTHMTSCYRTDMNIACCVQTKKNSEVMCCHCCRNCSHCHQCRQNNHCRHSTVVAVAMTCCCCCHCCCCLCCCCCW